MKKEEHFLRPSMFWTAVSDFSFGTADADGRRSSMFKS